MRYHIRKKAAIKIGLVIIAMVFILPFLVSKLEGSSSESEALNRRRKKVLHDTHVAVKDEEVNNVVENPMEVKDQKPPEPQHTYGPTAVLKPGVLGNFEPVDPHPKSGPGEGGQAVYTGMEEKIRADQSVREFGFNMVNSDKIAMNRTIPDTRLDECKYWQYPTDLPTASVILVFHNEGWSTLVRTVHSVINTSPPNLLHEVVMVDDFSDKDHLKGRLEEYIKQFNGKVKLYRNTERMGLIGTRTRGAELSKGDVIVFLDAHCECNKNWLVPLLARIRYDRTIMTVPTIDIIDSQSFTYYSIYAAPKRGIFEWGFLYKESRVPQQELNKRQHESEPYKTIMAVPTIDGIDWDNFGYHPVYSTVHHRGIFEWGFLYKESQVPKQELDRRQHNSEPYKAPTHAGGLFAMDRKYFFEMGAYDPGLKIWGGKTLNYLLRYGLWQCGGSIEWVPCSRVGHVYRNHMPYGFGKVDVKIPLIQLNYMRVVEVWLDDEFKEYFYTREPAVRGYPVGDISQQLKFKKDHNCKSFKWFMENVAYEVYERFPPLPPNKAWGEFKTKGGNKCWDLMGQQVGGGPIGLSYCHHFGGNQMFRLNTKGQIGVGERCIKASGGTTLHLTYCDVQPTGPWSYDENTGVVREQRHDKCVEAMSDGKLMLQRCIAGKPTQKWEVHETFSWKR